MGNLYRVKKGFGVHRRKPDSGSSDPGELIVPGQTFEPTPLELKAFGFKFERVHDDDEEANARKGKKTA